MRRREAPTRNVPTSKAERAAFVLSDAEILKLARWAATIEAHYGCADGHGVGQGRRDGRALHRPGPARDRAVARATSAAMPSPTRITSKGKDTARRALAIGDAAVAGRVCLIENARDIDRFVDGSILVTGDDRPRLGADHEARRGHRHRPRRPHLACRHRQPRLGLPAIVGTGNATEVLHDEQEVTVSCAEGDDGIVYDGTARVRGRRRSTSATMPETRTQVMLNLANPAAAFRWWRLPADGVGLARMEFVISNHIRIHPHGAGALRHAEGRGCQGR